MNQPSNKKLSELLNDNENNEYICDKCGYESNTQFNKCINCGYWVKYPTIAEWGKKLPIGVEQNDSNSLQKSFELIPINWKIEKEINKCWGNSRNNISLSDYMSSILACTVTSIADQDITKFKLNKKILIFNQMYQADVFYMYAYLRLISLGKNIKFNDCYCIECGHRFDYTADLTSLEVVVIDNPSELIHEVKLENGFEMAGNIRTKFKIKPPLWNMLDSNFPADGNKAKMFLSMLSNCVCEIDGIPEGAIITEREVSQFSKVDISICENSMDEVISGPRWEIEGKCERCDSEFFEYIDWTYNNFFTISSRSQRQRRRLKM